MSFAPRPIKLLDAATGNTNTGAGDGWVCWAGGKGTVKIRGTLDSATVVLDMADNAAGDGLITVADIDLSASPGVPQNLELAAATWIRGSLTGAGGSTDITLTVY